MSANGSYAKRKRSFVTATTETKKKIAQHREHPREVNHAEPLRTRDGGEHSREGEDEVDRHAGKCVVGMRDAAVKIVDPSALREVAIRQAKRDANVVPGVFIFPEPRDALRVVMIGHPAAHFVVAHLAARDAHADNRSDPRLQGDGTLLLDAERFRV